ncbi:MAG: galactose-1-phosphate uridylyltransferase [Candidatus Bathyarchaeia archaeon]
MANELRKDYILDRWVVVASHRRRRPTDFMGSWREEKKAAVCPFCPGNEHLTPPASLIYFMEDCELKKDYDRNGDRRKNWIVRCIPNLYPAFSPQVSKATSNLQTNSILVSKEALGHHEVLIESPNHDEHPSVARIAQLTHVINALKDRVLFFMSREYVKYVSIFRNHGANAGASLSHAHSQIIATPILPKIIEEENIESKKYYAKNKHCVFCRIIEMETKSERFIWGNNGFIVFAPWASINPFEFWIFPKRHQSSIVELTEDETRDLAEALRVSLGGLRVLLGDPPYNLGFHMIPEKHYHWHIEVYPKLAIWAGFEKSTGMYINTVPPEEAARDLSVVFEMEKKALSRTV